MNKRKNHLKQSFLASIPAASFFSNTDLIAGKCKFNFSYMDSSQAAGQEFRAWKKEQLCKLLDKVHHYCKHPLEYWTTQRVGAGGLNLLEIYGDFPKKSEFVHPKHVPSQARWARFRLEGAMRLIGFVIPNNMHDNFCKHTGVRFDENTFYVVFLDANHKFYKV